MLKARSFCKKRLKRIAPYIGATSRRVKLTQISKLVAVKWWPRFCAKITNTKLFKGGKLSLPCRSN